MLPRRTRSDALAGILGAGLSLAFGAAVGCNAIAGTGDLHVVACGTSCADGGPDAPYLLAPPVPIFAHGVDKVDLLFVVDNSSSMADKQLELARGIPALIRSLVDPKDDGVDAPQPVVDLHVAVITSSLGSHGTSACSTSLGSSHLDDRGHLLPRPAESAAFGWHLEHGAAAVVSGPCPAPVAASALRWVQSAATGGTAGFVGDGAAATLETATSCIVVSAQEDGCGYEETWESLYHFLIDPSPYAKAEAHCTSSPSGDDCIGQIEATGVDDELLAQRAGFLRPDSLLAIVVLSDENDASLAPLAYNWIPWAFGQGGMQRGWAKCANVPDDFESGAGSETALFDLYGCRSCFEDGSDPNCAVSWAKPSSGGDDDATSLRAFAMTQRFGFNFLWPRERYVAGLLKNVVPSTSPMGKLGPNPIYAGGFRTSDLVLVTGIVGVPPTLVHDDKGRPKALDAATWDRLVSTKPSVRSPHLIESIAPRPGVALYDGDRTHEPVNGGDRKAKSDELQFACIAPRFQPGPTPLCADPAESARSPLCTGNVQTHYGAYPGLRHLRILHDLSPLSIVSSICAPDFAKIGESMGARIEETLHSRCLEVSITPDTTGYIDAVVYEVFADATVDGQERCDFISNGYCTPGGEPCRRPAGPGAPPTKPEDAAAGLSFDLPFVTSEGVLDHATAHATLDGDSLFVVDGAGKKRLVCEVKQLAGGRVPADQAKGCTTVGDYVPSAVAGGGFCYTQVPSLFAAGCATATGSLRFVGNAKTRPGSDVFISLKR